MSEAFLNGRITLHAADCADVIRTLPDNSIDSCVTDPPYALVSIVKRFGKTSVDDDNDTGKRSKSGADGYARLAKGFMGKEWDNGETAFAVEFWSEILRVLKPGGHVAAFGGTRSYHRLACAIEDAGFEIRDQLAWCYGTGFPKSHDVSKGIDKAAGAEREPTGEIRRSSIQRNGTGETWNAGAFASHPEDTKQVVITSPATDAARQWEGWGTALKPAWEPICLARKPLSEKTVAANVLRWGTGAINVGACRIPTDDKLGGGMVSMGRPKASEGWDRPWMHDPEVTERKKGESAAKVAEAESLGRFPANLCHDGSDEVLAEFPDTRARGNVTPTKSASAIWGSCGAHEGPIDAGDSGSAARFFYSAKADADDRLGSKHPTVKPVDLMQWLCRLLTPSGGIVLDPFAGTGSTGEAAWREGFIAILIEREEEYLTDIRRRMELTSAGPGERKTASIKAKKDTADPGPMFALLRAAE